MRRGKKLIALLLVMVFTVLNVNTISAEAKGKDLIAEQILKKSVATASKIKNFTMTTDVEFAMKYKGKTQKEKVSAKIQYNKKPMKIKSVSTTVKDGKKVKEVEYYAKKGNKIYNYTKVGNSYVKLEAYGMKVSDLNAMNPASALKQNMKNFKNTKIKSRNGKVSGRSAYVLTAEIAMEKLFEETEAKSEELEMFKGKKLKITYWIDKKTFYPLKYTVDIKSLYNLVLQNLSSDESLKLSKYTYTITYTKINKTGKVKIPSNVK